MESVESAVGWNFCLSNNAFCLYRTHELINKMRHLFYTPLNSSGFSGMQHQAKYWAFFS
jgi:hypothetical protein